MATSQRKPQGRGFAANPAVGGRGSRHETLVKGGSPGQPRPADGTPVRQTVGFNTVNERLLFAAQLLIGYTVQVQVKSGVVYEGIFHTADLEKDLSIVLKMAKVVKDPAVAEGTWLAASKPVPSLVIYSADLVQVVAADVRMGAADVGPLGGTDDAGGFGTDAAISRGRGGQAGRELQRWAPDVEDELGGLGGLEDTLGGPVQPGWDQFALNETKFGVKTDYNEELYTTELDLSKSKISLAEATRLAAEIERGNTTNIHIMEERGKVLDDSQVDEEDRYGAVLRQQQQQARPSPAGAAGPRPSALTAAAAAAGAGPRPSAAPGGSAANGASSQPPRSAWGGSKSAAAALFPGAQSQPQPAATAAGAGAAASKATAPINIDPRKEANKLRQQMTEPKNKSPYGTPKSPLHSPLISDAAKLEALNLNPGVPRVPEEVRRDFLQFKTQSTQQQQQQPPKPERPLVTEFKQFSQKIESKLSRAIRGSAPGSSVDSSTAAALSGSSTPSGVAGAVSPAAQPPGPAGLVPVASTPVPKQAAGPPVAAAVLPAAASAPPTAIEVAAAAAATEGAAPLAVDKQDGAATAAGAAPKSGLNPFAKSFTLNVNAKEFKPTWGGPPAAAPAASAAAPAATVTVAPAAVAAPQPAVVALAPPALAAAAASAAVPAPMQLPQPLPLQQPLPGPNPAAPGPHVAAAGKAHTGFMPQQHHHHQQQQQQQHHGEGPAASPHRSGDWRQHRDPEERGPSGLSAGGREGGGPRGDRSRRYDRGGGEERGAARDRDHEREPGSHGGGGSRRASGPVAHYGEDPRGMRGPAGPHVMVGDGPPPPPPPGSRPQHSPTTGGMQGPMPVPQMVPGPVPYMMGAAPGQVMMTPQGPMMVMGPRGPVMFVPGGPGMVPPGAMVMAPQYPMGFPGGVPPNMSSSPSGRPQMMPQMMMPQMVMVPAGGMPGMQFGPPKPGSDDGRDD